MKTLLLLSLLLAVAVPALAQQANLPTQTRGALPVAKGGTGTSTPNLIPGTNITITGSWPNQTINSSGGGGSGAIAGGTTVLGTSPIASGACSSVVTTTATGTVTTNVVSAAFNGDPTALVGYTPSTNGMLTIFAYPSTNAVNFKVCNNTLASITPSAVSLNWLVGAFSGGGGGTGTVTHTVGALTLGNFMVGNGGADLKDSGFSVIPVANGGTGTGSPALVPGTNVTITGSWPNQTINATSGGGTTIANGTAAMGTAAISSGTCATVVTVTATGVATTDVVTAGFNGDPTGVTGYIPGSSGGLSILFYPSTNNVNFKACNNTSISITPGALTLNWRVAR